MGTNMAIRAVSSGERGFRDSEIRLFLVPRSRDFKIFLSGESEIFKLPKSEIYDIAPDNPRFTILLPRIRQSTIFWFLSENPRFSNLRDSRFFIFCSEIPKSDTPISPISPISPLKGSVSAEKRYR